MTEIKAHKGTFKKKDGSVRDMTFAKLSDLPAAFLESRVQGTGNERKYPEGMELVFDLEVNNFRVFNHSTSIKDLEEIVVEFD